MQLNFVLCAVLLVLGVAPAAVGQNVRTFLKADAGDDIHVDSNGYIYSTDYDGTAIQRIAPNQAIDTLLVGYEKMGAIALDEPRGLLYAASYDFGYVIRMRLAAEQQVDTVAKGLAGPSGLVVDAMGNLFIATNASHQIQRLTPEGKLSVWAGGPPLNWPTALALDASGNMYATNMFHGQIIRISPAGEPSVFAALPAVVDGRYNLGYLAFYNETLYVAHHVEHRIYAVDAEGNSVVWAGKGEAGYVDAQSVEAAFEHPTGLAISPEQRRLYVTDGDPGRARLRIIDLE